MLQQFKTKTKKNQTNYTKYIFTSTLTIYIWTEKNIYIIIYIQNNIYTNIYEKQIIWIIYNNPIPTPKNRKPKPHLNAKEQQEQNYKHG